MSIGLIVVTVIALLIMLILFLLIGGGFRDLDDQSSACEDTFRGDCVPSAEACRADNGIVVSAGSSCPSGQVCCQLGFARAIPSADDS